MPYHLGKFKKCTQNNTYFTKTHNKKIHITHIWDTYLWGKKKKGAGMEVRVIKETKPEKGFEPNHEKVMALITRTNAKRGQEGPRDHLKCPTLTRPSAIALGCSARNIPKQLDGKQPNRKAKYWWKDRQQRFFQPSMLWENSRSTSRLWGEIFWHKYNTELSFLYVNDHLCVKIQMEGQGERKIFFRPSGSRMHSTYSRLTEHISNDGRTKLREWPIFSVICYSSSNGLFGALATKGCDFSVQSQMQECLD